MQIGLNETNDGDEIKRKKKKIDSKNHGGADTASNVERKQRKCQPLSFIIMNERYGTRQKSFDCFTQI